MTKDLRVGLDYTHFANLYADYQLSSSNIIPGELNVVDPWKVPSGGQFDLNASYKFNIGKCNATLYGNVNNLLNYHYIVDEEQVLGTVHTVCSMLSGVLIP